MLNPTKTDTGRKVLNVLADPRWHVVGLVIALQAVTIGSVNYSYTFWVGPWMDEFGANRGDIMMIISFHAYAVAMAAFFLGRLIDRLPPRPLVMTGIGAFALALALNSMAPSHWFIMAVYVLVLPVGIIFAGPLIAMTLVAKAFDKGRGLAIGIAALGTSVGGMIFPFINAHLMTVFGWRETHMIVGLGTAAVLLPLAWLVLSRPLAKPDPSATSENPGGAKTRNVVTNLNFWFIVLPLLMAYMGFSAIQYNIAPHANDLDIGVETVALLMSVMAFSMIGGKLLIGALSDRLDHRHLFLSGCVLLALAAGLLTIASGPAPMFVAFAFLGFGAGAFMPLKSAMIVDCFGPADFGRVMGLTAPVQAFSAVGPLWAGSIRDATGSYALAFYVVMGLMVLSGVMVLFLRSPKPASPATSPSVHTRPA